MKRTVAVLLVTLGCVGQAGIVASQDAAQLPDLKGRWVGTSEAVVLGNAPHYDAASHSKPRLSAAEFTLTIEGQDGRRFWGNVESKHHQEQLVGVIGFDGKTLRMQDHDGLYQAALVDRDTIENIYSHTGGAMIAAATRLKRQR